MPSPVAEIGLVVGELLKARKQTVAVSESSAGGLINAALVAVPGASAYYLGGAVVYTGVSRLELLRIEKEEMKGIRSASEPYAQLAARRIREPAPPGDSRKPARAGRQATATATRPAMPASQ
jgi:nicotinamide mononucleotide (NMN) deamidase PncC